MSDQARGRPVLKRIDLPFTVSDLPLELQVPLENGRLWMFCGEYDGNTTAALDDAEAHHGAGIYKVFPSGSWAGGYLRD